MSIINDALKKTQMHFSKPSKNKKRQSDQTEKSSQDITNVYEKMYEKKKIDSGSTGTHVKQDVKPSQKTPPLQHVKNWLKLIPAFIFLIVSLYVSFLFLLGLLKCI